MEQAISTIAPLTQLQRERARENARKALMRQIGESPRPKQYMHQTVSKYPALATGFVAFLCIVVLLAAFATSATRLYAAGHHAFASSIPNDYAGAMIAGIATILIAEFGQLVFSLAYAFFNEKRLQRFVLAVGIAISTLIAFAGNISIMQPAYDFAWIETLAPPALVVFVAYILKEQWLHSIEARYAGKRAYEEAMQQWHNALRDLEEHPAWQRAYINALVDAVRAARRKQTEHMHQRDMLQLAMREMQADDVVSQMQQIEQEMQMHKNASTNARMQPANNNGHITNDVRNAIEHMHEGAEEYTAACPHCNWEGSYASKKSARFALTAHMKKHPEATNIVHVNGKVEAVNE